MKTLDIPANLKVWYDAEREEWHVEMLHERILWKKVGKTRKGTLLKLAEWANLWCDEKLYLGAW